MSGIFECAVWQPYLGMICGDLCVVICGIQADPGVVFFFGYF